MKSNLFIEPSGAGALLRGYYVQLGVRAVRDVPAAGGDGEEGVRLRLVERPVREVAARTALEIRAVQLPGRLHHL